MPQKSDSITKLTARLQKSMLRSPSCLSTPSREGFQKHIATYCSSLATRHPRQDDVKAAEHSLLLLLSGHSHEGTSQARNSKKK